MSRHNYTDDCCDIDDYWRWIRWRGAVASALRGKRGQAFLRELLAALDAMPQKRLIRGALQTTDGECCALGVVAKARGLDIEPVPADEFGNYDDDIDREDLATMFGIAEAMAAEITYENDDQLGRRITPERRWEHVRSWVAKQIANGNAT